MENTALYLHIPFCIKKCPYCDFYSVEKIPDQHEQNIYLKAIIQELRLLKEFIVEKCNINNISFVTFYAGGGTPSLFSPSFFYKLFNFLHKHFNFSPVELTLEANPETLDQEKTKAYLETGFNRISIGIQSFFNKGLNFLGRIHNAKKALKAVEFAQKAGFKRISVDLIFGWKGQGEKTLKKELIKIVDLKIPHISIYELTIEPNTPFYARFKKKHWLSEKKLLFYYRLMESFLEKYSYQHYEISNYALKGYECIHNLFYWKVKPYLGLGASAVSRISNLRWENPANLKTYYFQLFNKKKLPLKIVEKLSILTLPEKKYLWG